MANKVGDLAVYVKDKDGQTHWFMPGDVVPGWAAKQMGAHCFAPDGDDEAGDGDRPPVPPQSGRGSSHEKWEAYAQAHDVDTAGLDRDGIIAACEEAGVPVE
jgi:hypothetical protein